MRQIHRLDLTGKKFGKLKVLQRSGLTPRGEVLWECLCACGMICEVRAGHLRRGNSKSCGCGQLKSVTSHGMTGTPTFRSWESMKQRCLNPNAPDFKRYGGRGIKIHPGWVHSFETFLKDMGLRPIGKTLDRIDNGGNYTPKNCQWSTPEEQARNRRHPRKRKES